MFTTIYSAALLLMVVTTPANPPSTAWKLDQTPSQNFLEMEIIPSPKLENTPGNQITEPGKLDPKLDPQIAKLDSPKFSETPSTVKLDPTP